MVTTSTVAPARLPFTAAVPPVVARAVEVLGLQYTNITYIHILVAMAIPFGLIYLWPMIGSAISGPLFVAALDNLTAPLFWPNYGILAGFPGFASSPPAVQMISYFATVIFCACLLYLIQIYTGPERNCPPIVNRNLVSAFVSGFVVTASVAYIAALSGMMTSTAFEALWAALTAGGYAVQQRRDKQKGPVE
ncbi:hypothetical protein BESB_037370 [Besnoitia besnoiti]|uniref:Transmembrane protein n=1 Tax=Besnoitia besnoiti TaxID=94643 RepID=A0A2A9MH96_BESBE|nr:hypothetical protein BESB_037370 [Besnoitia besnoiti]PFH37279.1 hypothetical protein BESB_037370 [Besnoitia besnoiti]